LFKIDVFIEHHLEFEGPLILKKIVEVLELDVPPSFVQAIAVREVFRLDLAYVVSLVVLSAAEFALSLS